MHHNEAEVKAKLLEMYPEIEQHQLSLDLESHPDEGYWIVKLERGHHKLHTHLEFADADACLEGVQCVYLGAQIGHFVSNFELLGK